MSLGHNELIVSILSTPCVIVVILEIVDQWSTWIPLHKISIYKSYLLTMKTNRHLTNVQYILVLSNHLKNIFISKLVSCESHGYTSWYRNWNVQVKRIHPTVLKNYGIYPAYKHDKDYTDISSKYLHASFYSAVIISRADSSLAPSQWEMSLQSNASLSLAGCKPRISPDKPIKNCMKWSPYLRPAVGTYVCKYKCMI